jgi:hypothetical protein
LRIGGIGGFGDDGIGRSRVGERRSGGGVRTGGGELGRFGEIGGGVSILCNAVTICAPSA